MTEKKNQLHVVSLFSGAGGLDIAACSTGLVGRLFSSDSNPVFLQTVIDNMPSHFPAVYHRHLVADAHNLTGNMIQEALSTDKIDLVMGGPPCDDFTTFGRKHGAHGKKAPLIMEFSRLVCELRPRAFIFENVPNLARQFNGFFDGFLQTFAKEYRGIMSETLAAMRFGAPTLRERLFVVGFRCKRQQAAFRFPEPTHGDTKSQIPLFEGVAERKPFTTVRDVLSGLPDVTEERADQYLNHTGRRHRPQTIEHLKSVPQGVAVRQSYRYRAPWDGPCRSLTAGVDDATKSYIHPAFHREMSVREYSRIHGFPDSWVFNGNHHNGIKQVANAVPVPLGCAVVSAVTRVIRGCCS